MKSFSLGLLLFLCAALSLKAQYTTVPDGWSNLSYDWDGYTGETIPIQGPVSNYLTANQIVNGQLVTPSNIPYLDGVSLASYPSSNVAGGEVALGLSGSFYGFVPGNGPLLYTSVSAYQVYFMTLNGPINGTSKDVTFSTNGAVTADVTANMFLASGSLNATVSLFQYDPSSQLGAYNPVTQFGSDPVPGSLSATTGNVTLGGPDAEPATDSINHTGVVSLSAGALYEVVLTVNGVFQYAGSEYYPSVFYTLAGITLSANMDPVFSLSAADQAAGYSLSYSPNLYTGYSPETQAPGNPYVPVAAVPEPGILSLLLVSLIVIFGVLRSRRLTMSTVF